MPKTQTAPGKRRTKPRGRNRRGPATTQPSSTAANASPNGSPNGVPSGQQPAVVNPPNFIDRLTGELPLIVGLLTVRTKGLTDAAAIVVVEDSILAAPDAEQDALKPLHALYLNGIVRGDFGDRIDQIVASLSKVTDVKKQEKFVLTLVTAADLVIFARNVSPAEAAALFASLVVKTRVIAAKLRTSFLATLASVMVTKLGPNAMVSAMFGPRVNDRKTFALASFVNALVSLATGTLAAEEVPGDPAVEHLTGYFADACLDVNGPARTASAIAALLPLAGRGIHPGDIDRLQKVAAEIAADDAKLDVVCRQLLGESDVEGVAARRETGGVTVIVVELKYRDDMGDQGYRDGFEAKAGSRLTARAEQFFAESGLPGTLRVEVQTSAIRESNEKAANAAAGAEEELPVCPACGTRHA